MSQPVPSSLQSARTAAMQPSLIRAVYDRRRPSSLNLGLGQPSLPVPDAILDEGQRRLRLGSMGYTANAGLTGLREAIARHHDLEGRRDAASVVVTCGAQEAILAVMMATLDPGDEVVVPDPGFPSYAAVATLLGARAVAVPRDPARGFRLIARDVEQAVTAHTRLLVLNSPGNPTGSVDDDDELRSLAALVDRRDIAVLSDEIYADLCYLPHAVPSIARHTRRVFLVSGLSKSCAMTGFRLGYVVGDPIHMTGVLRAHHMAATCAPTLSQHMAQFVFENPQWLTHHHPIYTERRAAALKALHGLGCPVLQPDGAFYVMIDLSSYTEDSLQLALDLLDQEDVITAPGAAFGHVTRSWLRLTFADEPRVFEDAVTRIGRFLQGRGRR
ncbi:MAG: aminotransferase class I/II-fold pyridoxal phosphate-dependent enzyme [Pseudomonadota bacterium]